jgi:hypothetical protein
MLSNSLEIRVAQYKKRVDSLCLEVSFSILVLILTAICSLVLILELSNLTSIPAAKEGYSLLILNLYYC